MADQHIRVLRCFVALEVPADIQEILGRASARLAGSGADVGWVKPENIHLTLKFLGEIPQGRALQVGMAVSRLKGRIGPVPAALGGLGAFPVLHKPRVVWAGLSQGTEECGRVFAAVEGELADMGFQREEREFSPHLTLGRVRSDRNVGELVKLIGETGLEPVEFSLKALTLMKSSLTPQGSVYEPMNTAYLAG
ncbi:MAG TPA: RNA 2',3'-cyclic phosphodiesterase [candidate division Zixibacteria bacterium]|jgi:2'-5' RNA ligase|nr:RNA 2',3'-cyclic phosphodiesterase [candidate division Zixibacteria bacterium]